MAIYFSDFCRHWKSSAAPKAAKETIRREALARLGERLSAARADCELDFSDLSARLENALFAGGAR